MGFGTPAKILRVDLSSASITTETFDETFYRQYPGGKALASYFLLHEIPPHCDPLGPENALVVTAALLTGTPIATATRYTMAALSPLTGGYGESEAGGFWGPELKFAGFEGIVITGKSPEPVYLWIQDGQAEIRPARHLWGQHPDFVQQAIRDELNDRMVRILQIGIAGENLVRYAAATNELRHFNGRSGMGAVMGSKNLKAIAVRGHTRYAEYAANPEGLAALGRRLVKESKEHPISWDMQQRGTPGLVGGLNAAGILPTLNFRMGSFEHAKLIDWETYEKEIFTGRRSCYACSIRCKREVASNDRYQVSGEYGGPEYETIAAFGSDCGVCDIQAVAKVNELCNRYTLDTISTGATIAFAMECFENGLIGLKDTDGIELRFGNVAAMIEMVERIARRQGFGNLLAEGSLRAAQSIGGNALEYAIQVKGQELPMHDPRGKVSVGLGYAISETGADHLTSIHDTALANPASVSFQGGSKIGPLEGLAPRDLSDKKVEQYFLFERWSSFGKSIGLCYFGPAPRSFIQVEDVLEAIHMASGWEVTVADLLEIGERALNMARIFNLRHGFGPQDDTLPKRIFAPLENGVLQGQGISEEEFGRAMKTLYRIKGWDETMGIPIRQRIEALGLSWTSEKETG